MNVHGQHVAPLKRCIDLHQVGQRQRHHRHADQRVEQEEIPWARLVAPALWQSEGAEPPTRERPCKPSVLDLTNTLLSAPISTRSSSPSNSADKGSPPQAAGYFRLNLNTAF